MSATRRVALLCLAVVSVPAAAQPKAGQIQPDKIAVGTIYTGAIVEASFMVFEPGTDPKIKMEVTAPKFVKVLTKGTHHQQFGPGNDFVCGTVEFAIETAAAGDQTGEVAVTLGGTKVKVPITATIKERKKGFSKVLIAETAFQHYSNGDG